MSLALLTDPEAVLQAIAEFDELGRDAFLKKYGYGKADRYFLEHNGQRYDSKAIAGVAVGKQHPDRGPLTAAEFPGGNQTVKPKLEELGFTVSAGGLEALRERWEAGGPWTNKEAEWRVARDKDLPELQTIMRRFQEGELDAATFRFEMDKFGKHTGYAGFGGISGQMFFNVLVKAAPDPDLGSALRSVLTAPHDAEECRSRFDTFLAFLESVQDRARDEHLTVPSSGYLPYFLSFFWEAQDRDNWPIYYPASRNTLIRYGLFVDKGHLGERYLHFRDRMIQLRTELGGDTWEIESFLWTLDDEVKKKKPSTTSDGGGSQPGGEPEAADIYEALQLSELIFPDELVTSLALSLMTKPLVLLSGISGTGKTQLAVQLAEYLERRGGSQQIEIAQPEDDDSNIYVRLTEARLLRGRTNLTRMHQQTIALHGGLPERGTYTEYSVAMPGGPNGVLRLNNIGFTDPSRELFLLFFRSPLDGWLRDTAHPGDYLHLRFDDGAEVVQVELVKPQLQAVAANRHAVVAVKSDWTDPRGLLGYRNPITGEYVQTDALRLLLDATAGPDEPFILILDEMNLARVEYYFSDFLSAMELTGGAISLYADTTDIEEAAPDVPPRLQFPPNVLVIGTVNIDETTFMFSPKVLDRANVLVFNDVDVQRFFALGGEAASSTFRLASGDLDPAVFAARAAANAQALQAARGFQPFSEAIIEVFSLLESEGRHFGYRVLTEITTFVGLALELVDGSDESAWRTAFDLQLVQKVLPKLSGGRELESVLARLLSHCLDPSQKASTDPDEVLQRAPAQLGVTTGDVAALEDDDAATDESGSVGEPTQPPEQPKPPAYPRAARVTYDMLKRLRQTGFVSFFE